MKELERMYEDLGVSRAVYAYGEEILDCLKPRFAAIPAIVSLPGKFIRKFSYLYNLQRMPAAVKPKAKKMSRRNRLPRGMVRYSDVPDVVVRHEKQRQCARTHMRARDRLIVDDQDILRRLAPAQHRG